MTPQHWWADLIARVGLAFAFLYPPYSAIIDPNSWISYFPEFLRHITESVHIPDLVLLHSFGALEVVIALWLLTGWRVFWPALLALLMLAAIIIFNEASFEILFRDVTIAALALSIVVSHAPTGRMGAEQSPQ